jgi:DNA-binding NtrC family response regulator
MVTGTPEKLRILAVVAAEMQDEIRRQLTSFGMVPTLVSRATELAHQTRNGEIYHVVLLPAALPRTDEWWTIWGELVMLSPKPAILVYAQTATFQLWSGVLEAGGYDVIVEPLTDEKLKDAILRAAETSEDIISEDVEPE